MATATTIGTEQNAWTAIAADDIGSTGAVSAVDAYAFKSDTTLETTSGKRFVFDLAPTTPLPGDVANSLALLFYGRPVNEKFKARLWGVSNYKGTSGAAVGLLGHYLGDIEVKMGTGDPATQAPFNSSDRFCDTISVTDDATLTPPGIRVFGDKANGTAIMVLDTAGMRAIYVEVDRIGSATHAGLAARKL